MKMRLWLSLMFLGWSTLGFSLELEEDFSQFGFTQEQQLEEAQAGFYDYDLHNLNIQQEDLPEDCVAFQNPVLKPGLTMPKGSKSQDQIHIPEGLTLLGNLCKNRHTVIYVHGWSDDGSADNFFHALNWQEKNYNTFIYLWHRDAFQKGIAPTQPQRRVWETTTDKLISEYKEVISLLGADYQNEVRVVGFSLGTQLASYFTYKLLYEQFTHPPTRLELLDPYVGPNASLPVVVPGVPKVANKIIEALAFMLDASLKKGVAIIDYASITAGKTAGRLEKYVHVQEMSPKWMGGSMVKRHTMMRNYYFGGINEKRPLVQNKDAFAFSSQTPTEEIINSSRTKLLQKTGIETATASDDIYLQVPAPY